VAHRKGSSRFPKQTHEVIARQKGELTRSRIAVDGLALVRANLTEMLIELRSTQERQQLQMAHLQLLEHSIEMIGLV
jgi:hypothetical protein